MALKTALAAWPATPGPRSGPLGRCGTVTLAPTMLMSTQRAGGGRKEMMSSYCYDKNRFDFADPLRGSQQCPGIHAPYFHNCHSKF